MTRRRDRARGWVVQPDRLLKAPHRLVRQHRAQPGDVVGIGDPEQAERRRLLRHRRNPPAVHGDVDELLGDRLDIDRIEVAQRLRTPARAQGTNDVRVVRAESDNIVASLRERGVPVTYLVADDEGHGFSNPENQIRLYRANERHFGEHLGGRAEADA